MTRNGHTLLVFFTAGATAGFFHAQETLAQILFEGGVLRSQVAVSDPQPPSNIKSHAIQSFPIHMTLTAQAGNSHSITTFDMEVSGDSADWLINASHRLTGFEGFLTSSGNTIRITPSVDSLFSVDSWFNYNHPSSLLGRALIQTRILRIGPNGENLGQEFFVSDHDGTFGLGPPVGTLLASGTHTMLAGRRYQIDFLFHTTNWDPPPPGAEWLGNGQLHITINPVPEPATLALLAAAIPFMIHRRLR